MAIKPHCGFCNTENVHFYLVRFVQVRRIQQPVLTQNSGEL